MMIKMPDSCGYEYFKKWYISPSSIHGKGVFANQDIPTGSSIGTIVTTRVGAEPMITQMGSTLNHGDSANGSMELSAMGNDRYDLIAKKDIKAGSEITVNYNIGPDFIARPKDCDPAGYKNWR